MKFIPNKTLVSGLVLLGLILFSILFSNWLSPFSITEQHPEIRLAAPDKIHWLGTDAFGRDILSRTLHGGKMTVFSSATALAVAVLLGIGAGVLTGLYQGKLLDVILMRVVDMLISFPFILLAMVVTALFGANLQNLLFVVSGVWWVHFARLSRSIVMLEKKETAVEAAYILGANSRTIVMREFFPKIIPPVLIQSTFEFGNLILAISALSFLGLGAQPPTPEWGSMLADGRIYFLEAPHIIVGPTLFISLTVLALNLIGEGLRDYYDPYEKLQI